MMGRGKISVTGRDSEEEKKGEFLKKVTSAERSIDEFEGNNNDNPSEVGSSLRRCISWPWRKACLVLE